MIQLSLRQTDRPLHILCLGAHSDDIEIGCGGLLFEQLQRGPTQLTWVVVSAAGERALEARRSARAFLRNAQQGALITREFDDGFFPAQYAQIKEFFEELGRTVAAPDLILTHRLEDRHQDHRLVAELTWNTWRDHFILEYEIAKYEGDLGQPNAYVALSPKTRRRKLDHLMRYFASQRSKSWFRPEVFDGLLSLRGVECRAASGAAEAFHARKLSL
jgi:LmbE family N-acetylglucosaminyl deacetylase